MIMMPTVPSDPNEKFENASSRHELRNGPRSSVASVRKEYEWDPKLFQNKHQIAVINEYKPR